MGRQVKRSFSAALVALASACALATSADAFEPRVPDDYFGVSAPHLLEMARIGDTAALDLHAQHMGAAGLGWARVTIDWRMVEPLLGVDGLLHVYDWTAVDRLVASLSRAGVTLMPNVYGTPFWARDLTATLAGCTGNAAIATAHLGSFGALVKAMVARYGRGGRFWESHPELPYRPVDSVELWNEPNWTGYWCPTPDPLRYAQVLGAGARAAKDADPDVRVVLGGLVVIKETAWHTDGSLRGLETGGYLDDLMASDPALAEVVDAIGIHLYEPDVDSNLSVLGWLRARLGEAGLGHAELLVTEFGWRTGGPADGAVTEATRADRVRALATELPRTDCGLAGLGIHDWTNLRSDPANLDHWFSIADLATAALTPTGHAYKDAVDLYEGRGPTPAPREVIPVCGGTPPDQDEDGSPDESDDFPLDPERQEGGTEPPPPDSTPPPEQPIRPPRASERFFTVANRYMPEQVEPRVPHYDEMERVGVRSVDETVDWMDIEPASPVDPSDRFRWADLDRRILSYAKRNIATKLTFIRAPGWLPASPVDAAGAYADMMQAVARRYGPAGSFWTQNQHLDPALATRDFHVWSAANTTAGAWDGSPSPDEYADTYVRTRDALRGADPGARAIVSLNDHGQGGSAEEFLRGMVAAAPSLRGGIDGVYVLSGATGVDGFESTVARLRAVLDETGNPDAKLYMGFGTSLVGPSALTEVQRADFYARVAERAPRLDCGLAGITLSSWTSRQSDPADPWDWYGVAHLGYAVAWPSALAYLSAARSFEGFGTQDPPRPALHPCYREALDSDGDGVPDAAESHPFDPGHAVPEASPPATPRFDAAPAEFSNVTRPGFAFSAAGAAGFHCRLDGGPWADCGSSRTLSWLADGRHRFEVRGVSAMGLLGPTVAHDWTVDTRIPDTSLTAGPSGVVENENVEFHLAGDEPSSRYGCRLDDGPWGWCEAVVGLTGLADGVHRFRAFAVDRAGNADPAPAYREFTVRAVPDVPSIAANNVTTQTPTFRFSAAHAHSFQCRFDEALWSACSGGGSHTPARPLRDGFHRFAVRGVGATGKPGPAGTWGFTADDTRAPDTSILAGPAGSLPVGPVEFHLGSDEEDVDFLCKLDELAWAACPERVGFEELAQGDHRFQAVAVDAGGNRDPSPVTRDFRLVERADAAAPEVTITRTRSRSRRARTAVFRVDAEDASAVESIQCSLDGKPWRDCAARLRLRRLRLGRHTLRAKGTDEWGNVGSARVSWRVRRR